MSSTRRQDQNDPTFRQDRYSSSPEFERGLLANLVAKRCALVDSAEDRELIWYLQNLSHQAGGLAAVASDIIARFPDRVGTSAMWQISKTDSQTYTAEEIQKIRTALPVGHSAHFILKGETITWKGTLQKISQDSQESDNQPQNEQAQKHPTSYAVSELREYCLRAAIAGLDGYRHCDDKTHNLERELSLLCVNPEWNLDTGGPWYFSRLIETLRDHQAEYVRNQKAGTVITALGKKVCDTLDYTAHCRGLTLMQGEARTGKSFAARAWCQQHPGSARFIETPTGTDEASFFRAISRGLGLGNFTNKKAAEIRERVETVLLTGNIVLVLDEAQRLWPRSWRQQPDPKRIVWVMSMVNARVPIALISTPQFLQHQKAIEKAGWNSAQLTGRYRHYEPLPPDLSLEDLKAVAKAVLPEADNEVLQALAIYARMSARYLAAIDSISDRARWFAKLGGRKTATTDDVRKAMQESVIPADTKLQRALADGKHAPPAAYISEPSIPVQDMPRNRLAESPAPATTPHRGNITEIPVH